MKEKLKIGDLVTQLSPLDQFGNWDVYYGVVISTDSCSWHEKTYKVYWAKSKIFTFEKEEHLHKAKSNEN